MGAKEHKNHTSHHNIEMTSIMSILETLKSKQNVTKRASQSQTSYELYYTFEKI